MSPITTLFERVKRIQELSNGEQERRREMDSLTSISGSPVSVDITDKGKYPDLRITTYSRERAAYIELPIPYAIILRDTLIALNLDEEIEKENERLRKCLKEEK